MNSYYNVLIDSMGVLLLCTIFFTERKKKRLNSSFNIKIINILMLCCVSVFAVDIPGLLLDGCIFPGARALLWFFDTAYWVLQAIYCYLWLLFADHWAFGSFDRLKKRHILYALPMLAEIAVILTTSLTGWVFVLDSNNVYARGSLYLANMTPYALYIVAALVCTVVGYMKTADPERRRHKLSLIVFMFLPIIGVLFDAFVYGISWVWPMVALSLLMVYLDTQQKQAMERHLAESRRIAQLAQVENELLENRMAIMLSQIQPHFLYNTLSTIKVLCRRDPPVAERAMNDFTEFLRGNMNSLTAQRPISFEKELEHTQHYLSLEKLRFRDNLGIVYDIRATLFRLPTLTLQPIVENAVRYGVTKREEGGTVTIATRESPDAFIITVADDGVGFDPMIPHDDGRTHIGIDNVKNRLEKMCSGSLDIHSIPGTGTLVTITIPKEK